MSGYEGLMSAASEVSLSERRAVFERRRRRVRVRVWSVVGVVVLLVGSVWGVVAARVRAAHEAVSQPVRWEARAGDPDVPVVVWPRGLPDHGRWADDPWVAALREYNLVYAAAYNTGQIAGRADVLLLTTPNRAHGGQRSVSGDWSWSLGAGEVAPVHLGPVPFEVLDVVEDPDGAAGEVTVCRQFDALSWRLEDLPEEVMTRTEGVVWVWRMVRGEDGHIRYVDIRDQPGKCTISDAHYGLFDPAPVRATTPPPEELLLIGNPLFGEVGSGEELLDDLMSGYDELRDLAEQEAGR